ncbi:MAG: hypothetical protein H6581_26975 [Bacteroidia bacterium]|nr:hypothetical protein [Bacteroidia bacterium]
MDKVIVVDLKVPGPQEAEKCYLSVYDKGRVELNIDIDDTLNTLPDFIFEEDPLEGPNCFMPEMKLIYKEYTYVISLYCTKVKKYKNSSAYTPSNQQIKNDLAITESVLDYLEKIRKTHFGPNADKSNLDKFVKKEKLGEDDIDELELLKDGDDDDSDLQKDALDKDGWFDDVQTPTENLQNEVDDDDDGKHK